MDFGKYWIYLVYLIFSQRLKIPCSIHFHLHDFAFDDLNLDDDDTLRACIRMFLDLDLIERFNIDYEMLCRWLLSVKKNYRHVTYHNWRHAFNVAQMMFSILTSTQWWKVFGEIECLALLIACLCHDLDHRGTNNSFQIKLVLLKFEKLNAVLSDENIFFLHRASSPLAQLYSTSTMEHHHFDQCLMILNSPGNLILSNLSSDDYSRAIRVLEDAILSTDLAVYFRYVNIFSNIFSSHNIDDLICISCTQKTWTIFESCWFSSQIGYEKALVGWGKSFSSSCNDDDSLRSFRYHQTMGDWETCRRSCELWVLRTGRYGATRTQHYTNRYHESWEGRPVTDYASWIHRLDLFTNLWGKLWFTTCVVC